MSNSEPADAGNFSRPGALTGTQPLASNAGTTAATPCEILLVEDHADTAQMMRRLLMRRGYVVTIAHGMADALAAVGRQRFDLMLADLSLPDGSGLDLMREVARLGDLPGIALSGLGMTEDLRDSEAAGFSAHLTKPVNLEKLWQTLDTLLVQCAPPIAG